MAFYCHQCGTGLPPTARFCSNCGTVLPVAHSMPGRPLCRPHQGRAIAGVCIALAQANGWDVAIVRILTILGFIVSGGFVGIAYLAGWIGIPEEPLPMPMPQPGGYAPNPGGYPPNTGAYPPHI